MSLFDTPNAASTPPQRPPRRVKRAALALALAGGVVAGGASLAHAAGSTPAPTSSGTIARQSQHNSADATGRVTALSGTTLTVTSDLGQRRSYALTSATVIHQGPKQSLPLSNLKVGDRVHVRADGSTSSGTTLKAVDVDVHLAHIDGVVVTVNGGAVTVTDHEGFTRRINVSAAAASSVRSGSRVHAEGRVDADGTTLDATTITTRTTPAKGGPAKGGPAKGGPAKGGPAKGGKHMKARAARPTSPATPSPGGQGSAPQQRPSTGPSGTTTPPANGS